MGGFSLNHYTTLHLRGCSLSPIVTAMMVSSTDMDSEYTDTQSSETEKSKVKSTDNILKLLSRKPWNTCHVMFNGCPYFCGKDISKALGYSSAGKAIRVILIPLDFVKLKDITSLTHGAARYGQGHTRYLPIAGVKKLALKSIKPEANTLAELLGFSIDTKYLHKEQEVVNHVSDYLHELKVAT